MPSHEGSRLLGKSHCWKEGHKIIVVMTSGAKTEAVISLKKPHMMCGCYCLGPLFEDGAFHLHFYMTVLRRESFWEAFVLCRIECHLRN